MASNIAQRVEVTASHRHEDKDGKLISASTTRIGVGAERLAHWDTWRVAYCESHRTMGLPISFREGEPTFGNKLLSVFLGYIGGN